MKYLGGVIAVLVLGGLAVFAFVFMKGKGGKVDQAGVANATAPVLQGVIQMMSARSHHDVAIG